jgi:hypothetical protein
LAAAVKVASQTSTSTTRDTNVKAEIEAAEAGLQVAGYRLSQLEPKSTQCINGEKAVETKCESGVEALGNHATFQYWTTLPLKSGETCAGRSVVAVAGKTLRCVTAEGLVNSIQPGVRVQELVSSSGGEALFGIKGMIGLSEFKATGTVKVPVPAVSNEKIIGEGSANFEKGYEICPPKGSFKPATGEERRRSGVMIAGKNPEAVPDQSRTSLHARHRSEQRRHTHRGPGQTRRRHVERGQTRNDLGRHQRTDVERLQILLLQLQNARRQSQTQDRTGRKSGNLHRQQRRQRSQMRRKNGQIRNRRWL